MSMIQRRFAGAILLFGTVAATGSADAHAQAVREWAATLTGDVESGDVVTILGVHGDIHVVPNYTCDVRVVASCEVIINVEHIGREVDTSSFPEVQLEEDTLGLLACAFYKSSRRHPNRCGRDSSYEMNVGRDDGLLTDFYVSLPRGIDLEGRTVNGYIEANGLDGNVKAETVTGGIEVSTENGVVYATTVNGNILASMAGPLTKDTRLQTVNGNISMLLPREIVARVSVRTVSGYIEASDLDLTITGNRPSGSAARAAMGNQGPKAAYGQLGDAGEDAYTITIQTITGSVSLTGWR